MNAIMLSNTATFLCRIVSLGFLNESCAATKEAKKALPCNITGHSPDVTKKTVDIFHDEFTYQANEGRSQKNQELRFLTSSMNTVDIYN